MRSSRLLVAAVLLAGLTVLALVAEDGSTGWRTVRVVGVAALTLLAAWCMRGGRQVSGGVVAVAVGSVGTVAGVGIGIGHLLESGLSSTALTGLFALGAGLVLLGAGSAMLV